MAENHTNLPEGNANLPDEETEPGENGLKNFFKDEIDNSSEQWLI